MNVKVIWNKRLNATNIMSKHFNPNVRKFAHNELKRICEPYVPMLSTQSGSLSQGAEATSKYLRYKGPYAFFQYMGLLMVGVESKRAFANDDERKVVVPGVYLKHSKELHPLATREWDKVALKNGGLEALGKAVTRYVNRQK